MGKASGPRVRFGHEWLDGPQLGFEHQFAGLESIVNGPNGPCTESCKLNYPMAEPAVPEGRRSYYRPRILQEQAGGCRHFHSHSAWSAVTFTIFAQPGPQVLKPSLFLSGLPSIPGNH